MDGAVRPPVRGRSACLTAAEAIAAGPDLLAALWWRGVRRLVVVPPPQADATGQAAADRALTRAVARFNRLLASRGLDEGLRVGRADRAERTAWDRIRAGETAENPKRRGLLRALVIPEPAADGGAGGSLPPSPPAPPLVRLQRLGEDRPEALFAAVPRIDPTRCDGCDGCVAACPAEALTLVKGPAGELGYSTDPALCTGCRLCVEICGRGAVGLTAFQRRPEPVPLTRFTCSACGTPVHEPAATAPRPAEPAGPAALCRICRQTRHHAKLFQVLE